MNYKILSAILGIALLYLVSQLFEQNHQLTAQSEQIKKYKEKVLRLQSQMGNMQIQHDLKESKWAAFQSKAKAEKRQEERSNLQQQYDETLLRLAAANHKLKQIQEFHFLRTAREKDQQVSDQLQVIQEIEDEVARIKQALNRL